MMTRIEQTLTVGNSTDEHTVGDEFCAVGWCSGGAVYPKPCESCSRQEDQQGCVAGLVHAEFGDESWDGYWLYTECDCCGEGEGES